MKSRQLLANRDAERMAYVSMRNQTQYAPHPQRRPKRGTPSYEFVAVEGGARIHRDHAMAAGIIPDPSAAEKVSHRELTERDRQRARNKGVADYKRSVKRELRELRRQADPTVKGVPTPRNPRPLRRHLMGA